MDRFTIWASLLLFILLMKHSHEYYNQCPDNGNQKFDLETDIGRVRQPKQNNETFYGECKLMENVISILNKLLEANVTAQQCNNTKVVEMQATICGLAKIVVANNRTLNELREKQQQHQATTDDVTKTNEPLIGVCRELIDAVRSNDAKAVTILVKYVSDNCTTVDGYFNTPLTYAAGEGRHDMMRLLLEGDAKIESSDVKQRTALHKAAWNGRHDICVLLLSWGANLDPLEESKETPMHYAARRGHLGVVQLLVDRGADLKLKNKEGQTASNVARMAGHKGVSDWLNSVRPA